MLNWAAEKKRISLIVHHVGDVIKLLLYLSALMLNAVRSNFAGDTGMFLQNFGNAFSMSFLTESAFHSKLDDVDDDEFVVGAEDEYL
jgi:hypothetical protein